MAAFRSYRTENMGRGSAYDTDHRASDHEADDQVETIVNQHKHRQRLIPFALVIMIGMLAIFFSPIVGLTVAKVDPRRYATFSFLVFALVLWMRSNFNTQADFWTIMIPTIIQGVAMAFFFIPLVTITLSGLTPDRIPAASGLSNFLRITAGAIGTSTVNREPLPTVDLTSTV